MKQKAGMDDERLRQLLRAGDPLGEGESLDPVAAGAMRRRVLAAAEPAPRLGWGAVAALATAALAVAAGVMLLLPGAPGGDGRVAEERSAEAGVPAVEVGESGTEEPPRPRPEAEPILAQGPPLLAEAPVAPKAPVASQAPPVPLPETGPRVASAADVRYEQRPRQRQIQLTTPGGTQIIWILNADVSL